MKKRILSLMLTLGLLLSALAGCGSSTEMPDSSTDGMPDTSTPETDICFHRSNGFTSATT
ncbi:MAG: hypothetical protein K6G29_11000 [Clostridiales bacterium]|nr:hypothetical protein [Clostridiales bacterium]